MIKKICFYIFLFFCFVLNIIIDFNIKNYVGLLNNCFNKNIVLSNNLYVLICLIIALISIFIIIDIIFVVKKDTGQNKGLKIKDEDATYGTANWMQEHEIENTLGINDVPGVILGKYNGNIVKLPFDNSRFNKNICVFGGSRKWKNILLRSSKLIRAFKIQKVHNCNRSKG